MILVEMAFHVFFIALAIYLLVLFFCKSARFPRTYIFLLASNLVFIVSEYVIVGTVMAEHAFTQAEAFREIGRAAFSAAIWIPYMLLSKRVRNTFVRTNA